MINTEKEVMYYESIDTIIEGNSRSNSQTLHKYNGREVIVGIRTSDKKNIFVSGVLSCPDFHLCERDSNGNLYNPLALNTEKITGLLVKITPTLISKPGDSKIDLTVKF
jgi:hypothetical protein